MNLFSRFAPFHKARIRKQTQSHLTGDTLEDRVLLSGNDTLPVLMVIADQQDFYYQEYGDTRASIEAEGVAVQVAATTTQTSYPHANTGEPAGTDGGVTPDIALADVNSEDYSAIVFVGGWGSSMYQYAFPGDYQFDHYDGDAETKEIVNNLIEEFDSADKHLGFICHATTIGAWSRINGESLFAGRQVSTPYIGSPPVLYNGNWYGYFELGQYEQMTANGAIANTVSGQYGDPNTVADDVVVDGNIITAENYDSAALFGTVIAQQVISAAPDTPVDPPPVPNQAPTIADGSWQLDENSGAGTSLGFVSASDPDAGQTLSYAIIGGNVDEAFSIDAVTGEVSVANSAALDFETNPFFQLQIEVTDNADSPLSATGQVTVQLNDVLETPPSPVDWQGSDLIVQGTDGDDTIYLWSSGTATNVHVWMNGKHYGGFDLSAGGQLITYGGNGNDRIYATDTYTGVTIYGEAGHDRITGGNADDSLSGGPGYDVIWANGGDDLIDGGADNDALFGNDGNDIILGGTGDDRMEGGSGRDIMIGGTGADYMKGEQDDDLLIAGFTDFDNDEQSLFAIRAAWSSTGTTTERASLLSDAESDLPALIAGVTVHDDMTHDTLCSGGGANLFMTGQSDSPYGNPDDLFV